MKTSKNLIVTGTLAGFATVLLSLVSTGNAQDNKKAWVAPAAEKTVKNPAKADDANIAAGKVLYTKHCKSCHGATGKGDGPKAAELETPTGDFSEDDTQKQTDGELHYKIKKGNGDMPSFEKKITDDDEIWQIVNYVRTFKASAEK
ncbi:MAG: c-type cytochrome [Bacteroidetes bacterium]|nr:c-type cytochrome [Bacteroidota bacterium]